MGSTFGERALQKHRTCATFGLTRKSTSLASLWLYQFVDGGKGELRLEAPSGLRRTEQVYEVYVVIFDLKTTVGELCTPRKHIVEGKEILSFGFKNSIASSTMFFCFSNSCLNKKSGFW